MDVVLEGAAMHECMVREVPALQFLTAINLRFQ